MTVEAVGSTDMRNLHDVVSNFIFDMDPDKKAFEEGTVKLDRAGVTPWGRWSFSFFKGVTWASRVVSRTGGVR